MVSTTAWISLLQFILFIAVIADADNRSDGRQHLGPLVIHAIQRTVAAPTAHAHLGTERATTARVAGPIQTRPCSSKHTPGSGVIS